jgi:hypothetical protein
VAEPHDSLHLPSPRARVNVITPQQPDEVGRALRDPHEKSW